ncbi:hypothetical protein TNCT_514031 [Trichonephila clavata]|uniref:Uncharacterized protein n=1 Tax=Trichonephila clavata TaxID=2740835 RepID=A0A8X6L912_TRICU|nr:hypothetical protein TNCT_514031 [Trichonephila clavata]
MCRKTSCLYAHKKIVFGCNDLTKLFNANPLNSAYLSQQSIAVGRSSGTPLLKMNPTSFNAFFTMISTGWNPLSETFFILENLECVLGAVSEKQGVSRITGVLCLSGKSV